MNKLNQRQIMSSGFSWLSNNLLYDLEAQSNCIISFFCYRNFSPVLLLVFVLLCFLGFKWQGLNSLHKSLSLIFYWCGIKVSGVFSFPIHWEYLPRVMHSPMLHLYVVTPLPSLFPTERPICPACFHLFSVTKTLKSLSKDSTLYVSVSAPHYPLSSLTLSSRKYQCNKLS